MFLQQLINALTIGSLYALTAMGATLIYGILGILDIANAGAYLVGAYVGWYIYYGTGRGCFLQCNTNHDRSISRYRLPDE